ncbi:hypothetical protein NBO_76g0010 [Nosema bombycis CQ1]|uniref:Uncharacterized protein n=1 Tax=Nosema bombycis (strain CQ1 / CVCC 102059) TaxID=578461 RepID=R0MH21_NOSB1|nr:hypothetical protein NBO_76g0010 [Nosema bombycis CQ1]|eukprot:EOB13405.1 hypothetical protein NBO_76g0010 [Nosema bombycis CQ1]
MIFISLYLFASCFFLCIYFGNKHVYESYITDFIKNTFDKNDEAICIRNSEGKEVLIEKKIILENIETVDFKTIGSDLFTMMECIKKGLDKRGPPPLNPIDDNLQELFDLIIKKYADSDRENKIKCLQEGLEKISGPILVYFANKELDLFPASIQTSIEKVWSHLNTFNGINLKILKYIHEKEEYHSVCPVYKEFIHQVFYLENHIYETIEYCNHFINKKKDYKTTMIELLNDLKEALIKEIYKISRSKRTLNDELEGEAHMLCCNLNYHSKQYFDFLNGCYDSSKKILDFLKNDAEKLKSN